MLLFYAQEEEEMTEVQKEYYSGIIDFLFAGFGETVEVSLFEVLENQKTSLCAKSKNCSKALGEEMDKNLLFWLRAYRKEQKYIAKLPFQEKNGDLSRVSLYYISDKAGKLTGVLSMKKNITSMIVAANFLNASLKALTGGPERDLAAETAGIGQKKQENTLFQYSQYLIEDYFDSLSTVGAAMSIEERMKVVEDLQQKGIFQLKGNISTVAKKLEISEKTLYRYLKNQS
ncbi:YheO-like protein [Fusobacterium necrophorum subsp. funduliforme ATCC 51357]|uniref:YheO-like protein n=1 Tax=Fusobacterium necrophorum DJ-2 TaxID=1441737 RepID=A0AB73C365_9FUSO|nr:YheO-like protein [Fusobacterium necrophorum subsp. funduliforme ATCC 51357]EYD70161.1 YheO domain-containing protein [Fusobacterium necrophorum subsp. funduliforme B35]KDE67378.1 hypothetical protein FUSO4_03165 [Fusobacterium necrophorum DJ-1]KDE72231.1 hypothetical protein FUSO8_05770 [Fusobacterium necrophorum DJ-2]MBR8722142.1 hypothetical protein [Fusobacterium necrophorum subsp. funduliforme]MBR8823776.1 hypothetical protein [Fusobacterium necrophorum]SQC98604.1 Uncharacterized prot